MKTKFTLRTKTLEGLLAKMLSDRDTSLGHHFFKLGGTQLEYFPVAVRVGSIDDFTKHKFFDLTDPHLIFMPLVDTKGGKVLFCNRMEHKPSYSQGRSRSLRGDKVRKDFGRVLNLSSKFRTIL